MRTLDVDFGDSSFELAIARLKAGDSFPAGRFLTLLEGEDEEAVEAAFDTLAERGIRLELSGIPKASPTGSGAARLHLEEKLAKSENIAEDLPEEDPLRLYLEELSQAKGDPVGEMLPKVVALAREYVGYGVLLMDLIQEDVSPEKIVRAVQVLGILQDLKTCCRKLRPHASRVSIRVDCLQLFIPALMAGRYDAAKNAGAAV